jgi:integrase/recombinase XerC
MPGTSNTSPVLLGFDARGAVGPGLLFGLDAGGANLIVLNYRNAMVEKGLAPATISRRIAAIKSLGKLARLIGAVSWSIEVDGPRVETLRDTAGPGARGIAAMKLAAGRGPGDPLSGFSGPGNHRPGA